MSGALVTLTVTCYSEGSIALVTSGLAPDINIQPELQQNRFFDTLLTVSELLFLVHIKKNVKNLFFILIILCIL